MLPLLCMASCQIACPISVHRREIAVIWPIGSLGTVRWFNLNQKDAITPQFKLEAIIAVMSFPSV